MTTHHDWLVFAWGWLSAMFGVAFMWLGQSLWDKWHS
jgi:hypothetical protein